MKKIIAAFSAFMLVRTMTACGSKKSESDSEVEIDVSAELTSDTSNTSVPETVTTVTTSAPDSTESDAPPATLSTEIPDPADRVDFVPVESDATEYVGKWECIYIVSEGETISENMGVPLYAVIHLEVNMDGTMCVIVNDGTPSGEAGMEREELYWDYLTDSSIYVTDEPNTDGKDAPAVCSLVDDGNNGKCLVFASSEEDAESNYIYFRSVDEYTQVDLDAMIQAYDSSSGSESVSDASDEG